MRLRIFFSMLVFCLLVAIKEIFASTAPARNQKMPASLPESLNVSLKIPLQRARDSLQRARHTFAGELVLLAKMQDPTNDELTYLERYQALMDYILKKHKLEKRKFFFSPYLKGLVLLWWGKTSVRTPLSTTDYLIGYTLADLAKQHTMLIATINTATQQSLEAQEAEHLMHDIQQLIDTLARLRQLIRNNQYAYEQGEIRRLAGTTVIAYSTLLLGFLATLGAWWLSIPQESHQPAAL